MTKTLTPEEMDLACMHPRSSSPDVDTVLAGQAGYRAGMNAAQSPRGASAGQIQCMKVLGTAARDFSPSPYWAAFKEAYDFWRPVYVAKLLPATQGAA